jgi:cytochrome c peroxidase
MTNEALSLALSSAVLMGVAGLSAQPWLPNPNTTLDRQLEAVLAQHGFTGAIESTLETKLGRRIDHQLAETGRLLFFDTAVGLNNDNNCSGCHSPTAGFGDTQSIAIGIENNGLGTHSRTATHSRPSRRS